MFELQIFVANILLPSVAALIGIVGAWLLQRQQVRSKQPAELNSAVDADTGGEGTELRGAIPQERQPNEDLKPGWLAAGCGALSALAAIWIAFGMRNGFVILSEDSWLRIPLGTTIVAVAAMSTAAGNWALVWMIRTIALSIAAMFVFPTGEGWEFLAESQNYWILAIVLSTLTGWWGMEQRLHRMKGVLALAWIPVFAATAALTSESFLGVTEPLLAVSSIFGCYGIAALSVKSPIPLNSVTGPSLFAFSSATANAQFNSFLDLPNTLTYLAMFSPGLAAVLSLAFLARSSEKARTARHVTITVAACLICALALIVWTRMSLGGGGEEEW